MDELYGTWLEQCNEIGYVNKLKWTYFRSSRTGFLVHEEDNRRRKPVWMEPFTASREQGISGM